MKYLGPLSSSLSGTRLFYVDFSNQLDTSETVTSIDNITSNVSSLNLLFPTILNTDVATKDGHVLPANKAMVFRAGCGESQNSLAAITIEYSTSAENTDSTIVYLKIVPSII